MIINLVNASVDLELNFNQVKRLTLTVVFANSLFMFAWNYHLSAGISDNPPSNSASLS